MREGESESAAEGSRPGISRREALKRGAVAGGAVLWVTPIVQNVAISAAGAAGPSPQPGPAVSFIAFRFTCGGTSYFVKHEGFTLLDQDGTCIGSVNNPNQNSCGVDDAGAASGCNTGLYTVVTSFSNGEATLVTVTLNANCTGQIDQAQAKCGDAHGGCHPAQILDLGRTAVFTCTT